MALHQRRYKALLIYVIISAILFLVLLPPFFEFIQNRPGSTLSDPLLNALPALDLSIPIFVLIHGIIISTIVLNYSNPHFTLVALAAYCTVTYFRTATIYLITLEPPTGVVLLHDPFVSLIAYNSTFVKDLFFSGHTATLMVLIYPEPNAKFRYIKLILTILVAAMLLIQHIHYTIDILAAPLFAFLAYWLIKKALKN